MINELIHYLTDSILKWSGASVVSQLNIMKTPTLDQQFLSSLSPEQKAQVWNYYRLITHRDIDFDQQVEQITQVWSHAEDDDRLLEWLEFIDYVYSDVDDADLPTAAKRAYLSEYLTEKVGLPPKDDSSYAPLCLECPQGKGFVAVLRDSQVPYDSATFQHQRCKNCGYEYGQHTKAAVGLPWPDA